jgi:hypothetical protein
MFMLKSFVVLLLIFSISLLCQAHQPSYEMDLPAIGKWMQKRDGEPANWLGTKFQRKELLEPINVIIVDRYSSSPLEAIYKLKSECRKYGYRDKKGHSWGYCAEVDGLRINQLPEERKRALSNRYFLFPNNHGRIMGPYQYNGQYIFVGAFSRESFKLFSKAHHAFRSFLIARNDFCNKLCKGSTYRLAGIYNLNNHIDTPQITTADHDGEALVIYANR